MSIEVEIRDVPPARTMSIRETIDMAKIGEAFGRILPAVFQHVMSNGGTIAGPAFGLYHETGEKTWDLEAGVVVLEPVTETDEIKASALPDGKCAVTVHVGPYDKLPQTWGAMWQWAKDNGVTLRAAPFEAYIDDMGTTPVEKLRTEIVFPIA